MSFPEPWYAKNELIFHNLLSVKEKALRLSVPCTMLSASKAVVEKRSFRLTCTSHPVWWHCINHIWFNKIDYDFVIYFQPAVTDLDRVIFGKEVTIVSVIYG